MKRLFDFTLALFSLVCLAPLFLVIALAIKWNSRGAVFYRGERLGKDAQVFRIWKFRTMVADAAQRGGGLTHRADPRITRVGKFLRRFKLDELPQLINVLAGEMSLVGPRPEDPRYLPYYSSRQRKVLNVRPGITSVASIRFRNEEELLEAEDWERIYIEKILPAKLELELNYLTAQSWWRDALILCATPFSLVLGNEETRTRLRLKFHWLEKHLTWVAIDTPLIIAAYALAILVRSLNANLDYPDVFFYAGVGVLVYIAVNYLFGIYQRFWRYARGQELVVLFFSVGTATALLAVADYYLRERTLPLGVIGLGGFFTFIFLGAVRYRRRLVSGARQMFPSLFGSLAGANLRVLIVGAGEAGQLAAWQIQNQMPGNAYRVIGFVDDNRQKHGMRIHDVKVYGDRKVIPDLCTQLHVDLILIAIRQEQLNAPRELLDLCRQTLARVQILPGFFDWLRMNGHTPDWIDLTDEELLQRHIRETDRAMGKKLLEDRVVLVTGAAGSIGSELCRQIVSYAPRCLQMIDVNESGLHDLQIELRAQCKDAITQLVLCDITDSLRLEAVFADARPHVVFHAAAYKHVPILEDHPDQAVRVNVLGTQLLWTLAQKFSAERFILISSDKAVNPVNVMGMTKLLGELMVAQDVGAADNARTISAAVRFGNVLGSRGSVLTIFEKQIAAGGPVTITHSDMTRYFMSIDEAVNLVIQAAAMTRGSELFLLDMGEPISILDLANRVIRARGLRPEIDIPIEIIGARPGEKMSEELLAPDEEKVGTAHPSIFRIQRAGQLDSARFNSQIAQLSHLVAQGIGKADLRSELESMVQSLRVAAEN